MYPERRFVLEDDFLFLWDRLTNRRAIDEKSAQDELRDFFESEFSARMKVVADYQAWIARQES